MMRQSESQCVQIEADSFRLRQFLGVVLVVVIILLVVPVHNLVQLLLQLIEAGSVLLAALPKMVAECARAISGSDSANRVKSGRYALPAPRM